MPDYFINYLKIHHHKEVFLSCRIVGGAAADRESPCLTGHDTYNKKID